MAVVVNEFYFTDATKLVLAAVIYVFAGDIPQDYCSLENLFQFSHIVDRSTSFMDSFFPLLYFIVPCVCESLAPHGTLKVLHNSSGHTVEVSVS